MFVLANRFAHSEIRTNRLECGSPILPIFCLFLLPGNKSLVSSKLSVYPKARGNDAIIVKISNKSVILPKDPARDLRRELARKIAFFVGSQERLITAIPGLLLTRRTAPTAPVSATYEPSLAVVAQGRKRANLGGTNFIFDQSRYLLTSLDLPVICNVIEASEEVPYLCFVLTLDRCPRAVGPRGDSCARAAVKAFRYGDR